MKIAFLNIYNGKVERGAEIFVKELANRLTLRAKVHVFQTGDAGHDKYRAVIIKGIPRLPLLYHFWVFLFTLKCLPELIKNRYDWIIPVNGRSQILIIRLVRLITGSQILITGHSGIGFDDRLNITIGKPDVFVALTPLATRWAKGISRSTKVFYIQNGVDISKFKPHNLKAVQKMDTKLILCVGALVKYKNIDLLISAVGKLKKAHLMIIGDGPIKEKVNRMGQELLPGRFTLIAHIPHQEIADYYRQADVFSLPSESIEAFGLVYIEAMACNIPVVAPDDENRRILIGEAGLFFKPGNTDDYSRKLDKALQTDFGDNPRKKAEKLSWEKVAGKYWEIFNT